ncbi:MAG: hypothetical protein ACXVZ1_10715, partial [Gaiellaceae bacterium]
VPAEARAAAIAGLAPELERAEAQLDEASDPARRLTRLAQRGFSTDVIEELAPRGGRAIGD